MRFWGEAGVSSLEDDMTDTTTTQPTQTLDHDLGTFEGFNFRDQSAIERTLTGQEVVQWDHDAEGEAEFWPSGDHTGVATVFKGRTSITYSDLLALDRALTEIGGDNPEDFLRIRYAVNVHGLALADLTVNQLDDLNLYIFLGTSFYDVRREAAYELFEQYYPEAFAAWDTSHCDGLSFSPDDFLDSPCWSVEEVQFGNEVALLVVPQ